jgi:hypothetical protein
MSRTGVQVNSCGPARVLWGCRGRAARWGRVRGYCMTCSVRCMTGSASDLVDDAVFRDLVIAGIVEPTSKADSLRMLTDLGAKSGTAWLHTHGEPWRDPQRLTVRSVAELVAIAKTEYNQLLDPKVPEYVVDQYTALMTLAHWTECVRENGNAAVVSPGFAGLWNVVRESAICMPGSRDR